MNLDSIILGHNPFFGTNHLDQARGEARAMALAEESQILAILEKCHQEGIRAMMMSTHPQASVICRVLREHGFFQRGWRIYPLVPYIQKYVRGANEKGLVNLVKSLLMEGSGLTGLAAMWSGGRALLAKDIPRMIAALVDLELRAFKDAPLGGVFLHDAVTDLTFGLGGGDALAVFRDHINKHYKVRAGLATKNLPLLLPYVIESGWQRPLFMASFNALGFYVNPSLEAVQEVAQRDDFDLVAMQTLASGALTPEAAYRFLGKYQAIRSMVVGLSRPEHIVETVHAIRTQTPHS